MSGPHPLGAIERLSPNDATTLATDCGPVPMNIGAVLTLERGAELTVDDVRSLLEDRLARVPRLGQRVVTAPPLCGRPVWVDTAVDLGRLVDHVHLNGQDLLDVAASFVCTPLPRDRPFWAARWVTGLPNGDAALVLVVHHCLADGLGGLAVLAALSDHADRVESTERLAQQPHPAPSWIALAVDAWRHRLAAVACAPARLRLLARGVRELRGGRGPRHGGRAARTSLNRRTGGQRRLGVVTRPLAALVESAHERGCTVNDLVLCAVAGAMDAVLRDRDERVAELVASVPVSTRHATTADRLGNATGVLPLALPLVRDREERLRHISELTALARGPGAGASVGPLGLAFRALARLGVFRWFIEHQRLVHTFVTNVRGPASPLRLAGRRVISVVPVAVTPGNVGASFDVLSYAGSVAITVVVDPEVVPELDVLAGVLDAELRQLVRPRRPSAHEGAVPGT